MKQKYNRYERAEPKYKHRRRESSSSSDEYRSSSSPKREEEVYESLKRSLQRRDQKETYSLIRELSSSKGQLGILRVTIANTFSFQKGDIEEFFEQFGRIENIVIKEPKNWDQLETKQKDNENIAYIIFSHHHSAVVALKVLQSVSERDKIVDARICCVEQGVTEEQTFNPMLGQQSHDEFVISAGSVGMSIEAVAENYPYVGTIGIDLDEKNFCLKERIMGAKASNFLKVLYICEKAVRLENEGETERNDLVIKLIHSKDVGIERSVLVMARNLMKYNTAIRYLHELFEQIVQEYKNSREKSFMIIPKDVHIRRWEKFKVEPALKFLDLNHTEGHAI